ncbi:MAG: S-layer homology domain-containing protein, partial [Anaerotignum sp.]|nr:S-layer homology domain-containing protein [Anaerotignum sp.]
MKKKFISLLLAVVMVLSLAPATAFAATAEATQAANELHALGLFGGTGTDANGNPIFDLDRAPTRQEAITVLVGLLGKTEEAKAGKWNMPFTDVDNWAKPFVGYAYANGIASGTSATTFGAKDTVTASQYLSFMLRVQGYESGKDFKWDKAWELSDQLGLTDGRYDENTKKFLRSDVVIISLQAYKMMEVLKTAPDWGLPADIKFIAEPKTDADLQNNILYKFLFGEYSLDFTNYTTKQVNFYTLVKNIRDNVDAVADTYTAIAGPFNNAHVGCGADDNGMFIDFPEASLTPEQIYEQQLIAMETAKAVQASLWEQGKITDSMSEKEIAQAYHDYLT